MPDDSFKNGNELKTFLLGLVMASTLDHDNANMDEDLLPFGEWVKFWNAARPMWAVAARTHEWRFDHSEVWSSE